MSTIDKETAKADMERFMTAFRLDGLKKEKLKEEIETCERLIEEGLLIVTAENKLEQILLEPIENTAGETMNDRIVYKQKRVRTEDVLKLENKKEIEKLEGLFRLVTTLNPLYATKTTGDDLVYFNSIATFFLPAQ